MFATFLKVTPFFFYGIVTVNSQQLITLSSLDVKLSYTNSWHFELASINCTLFSTGESDSESGCKAAVVADYIYKILAQLILVVSVVVVVGVVVVIVVV